MVQAPSNPAEKLDEVTSRHGSSSWTLYHRYHERRRAATICPSPNFHARILLKKYRKSRMRQMKREEYRRLRAMVPSIASKTKVSKVEVIEEAIKYIDELHSALIERLQTKGLPSSLQGMAIDISQINQAQIKDVVRRMLPSNSSSSSSREKSRAVPSFHTVADRRCKKLQQ